MPIQKNCKMKIAEVRKHLNKIGYHEITSNIFVVRDPTCWTFLKHPTGRWSSTGMPRIDGQWFFPGMFINGVRTVVEDEIYNHLNDKETLLRSIAKLDEFTTKFYATMKDIVERLEKVSK